MTKFSDRYPSLQIVDRDIPNVFELLHASDREKNALARDLVLVFPEAYLWLSPQDMDAELSRSLGSPALEGKVAWIWPLDASRIETVLPRLYMGAWALFFAGSPIKNFAGFPEHLETDPRMVLRMVERASVDAAILSWYDDIDWTIAFRNAADR